LSMLFALMVDTFGSQTSPPRGNVIDVSCVDGGCFRIFGITSQGAHR
jgi:hypothetical protein